VLDALLALRPPSLAARISLQADISHKKHSRQKRYVTKRETERDVLFVRA
jgi:hypothetical protein